MKFIFVFTTFLKFLVCEVFINLLHFINIMKRIHVIRLFYRTVIVLHLSWIFIVTITSVSTFSVNLLEFVKMHLIITWRVTISVYMHARLSTLDVTLLFVFWNSLQNRSVPLSFRLLCISGSTLDLSMLQ